MMTRQPSWSGTRKTPAQSIAKKKENGFFPVMIDQNGKPVSDAQFVLPTSSSFCQRTSTAEPITTVSRLRCTMLNCTTPILREMTST